MTPSQNFFDLVMSFEGLKLSAYKDVAGIWTIGYGTVTYPNGNAVCEDDICTTQQAQQYLADHVAGIQLPAGLSQAEYDACLDFCYNAGQGAWNGSTLKKDVVSGADAEKITNDFLMWDKAHVDGQLTTEPGLLRRRRCEAYLFINGVNAPGFYEENI